MKKQTKILIPILILIVLCIAAVVVEAQTKMIRHAMDDYIYDNKNHYLPCEQLPDEGKVLQIVAAHQDVIESIEAVNPGFVGIEIDTSCPGKADIIFWYGTHANRLAIEEIINAESFFGVPYRLQNW